MCLLSISTDVFVVGMSACRMRDNNVFVGSEESNDAAAFAQGLQPKQSELQYIPPAVNPFPGALDVLLFRSVLLVVRVYSLHPSPLSVLNF